MSETGKRTRVVIVGGGFAGLAALKELRKVDEADVVIIDGQSSQIFQPLLYQVATCGLAPGDIQAPIRNFLNGKKNESFIQAWVQGIDVEKQELSLSDGRTEPYDYLLITCGAQTNFFNNKNFEQYTFGLKNAEEALSIRNHILRTLERAARSTDEEERKYLLTFAVIGGGATGVELAGSLAELLFYVCRKDYPELSMADVNLYLFNSAPGVLGHLHRDQQAQTLKWLRSLKVKAVNGKKAEDYNGRTLSFADGEALEAHTVIWAVGVRANILIDSLGVQQAANSRAVVDEYLRLPGHNNVFLAGDVAFFKQGEEALPMTAASAQQMGVCAGKNLVAAVKGEPLRPAKCDNRGSLCVVGRGKAVGELKGFRMGGWFCWFLWAVVHALLPVSPHERWSLGSKFFWNTVKYDLPYRNQYNVDMIRRKGQIIKQCHPSDKCPL